MKRHSRLGMMLGALAVILPLLSACGTPAETPTAVAPTATTAAAEAPTQQTTTSEATATTAQPAAGQQTGDLKKYAGQTIRILMYEQVPTYSTVQRLKEFEDATGIKVEYEQLAEAEMIKKEQLDFSAHTGTYDVTNVHFWYIPQFAKSGYIEPLDNYASTMSVPEWDSSKDFVPSYLQAMKYQGKLYSLPFQGIVQILYYRKDLIKQYCNDKPPATMDELMSCAKAITEGTGGKTYGYTDRGSADAATFMSPAGWIYAWGVSFLDDKFRPQLATPEAIAAMKSYVTLLHDYGPKGQGGMGWAEAEQAILNGVAAMHADTHDLGPDMVDPKRSQVANEIGFAMPPKQVRNSQDFFASGLSINADSKHKEAAWLFVQWATATSTQKEQIKERSDFTAQSVLNSDDYKNNVPGGQVILEAAKVADPAYFPAIPEFGALSDAFSAAVSRMVATGPDSVEAEMAKANADVEKVLKDAGYYK